MARNLSGLMSLLGILAPPGQVSNSTNVNAIMDDIADEITDSLPVTGVKAMAADLPMGGFKTTNVGSGSARTDGITLGQVQDGKANWVAAGGTADAITATYSPAITVLGDGQECFIRASGANTVTTPTFSPNGLTARTIVKTGGVALAIGDIVGAGHELHLRYLLASTRWELLNPANTVADASDTVKGKVELATTAEAITGTDTVRAVTPAGLAAYLPPGSMVMYGAASAPTGWLLCDGAAVSRTTYANLFTAISTSYGVGDNSTTFNVPNLKSRVPVGYGTGSIVETQAAANWNVSDVITVSSNTQAGKPKLETGMVGQVTSDGTKPTGISLLTDYYVRRLSATTISLYDTFAHAIDTSSTTGRVDITNIGSGNHTLTVLLQARALGDTFGSELTADVVAHNHLISSVATGSGFASDSINDGGTPLDPTSTTGDTSGITNMPPSTVVNFIIKT